MNELEHALGYRFRKPELLRAALTHKSASAERGQPRSNERLEFLGDSVLSAIVAQHLYESHPTEPEGRLSKRKAALVSRPSLARWAEALGLGRHLILGPGEDSSGGRERPSIISDAQEAVLGAIFLDGGFEPARQFVLGRLADGGGFEETDYKSRLQEMMQKRHRVPPVYELVSTAGPEHDKSFSVKVLMGKDVLGSGQGKTKKEAEQAAARDAMEKLGEK